MKPTVTDDSKQIEIICKRIGYGRVMQIASGLWQKIDPVGALTVGPCYGLRPVTDDQERAACEAQDSRIPESIWRAQGVENSTRVFNRPGIYRENSPTEGSRGWIEYHRVDHCREAWDASRKFTVNQQLSTIPDSGSESLKHLSDTIIEQLQRAQRASDESKDKRIAELEQYAEYDRMTIENARWAKNFNLESFQHARERIIELEQELKQASQRHLIRVDDAAGNSNENIRKQYANTSHLDDTRDTHVVNLLLDRLDEITKNYDKKAAMCCIERDRADAREHELKQAKEQMKNLNRVIRSWEQKFDGLMSDKIELMEKLSKVTR